MAKPKGSEPVTLAAESWFEELSEAAKLAEAWGMNGTIGLLGGGSAACVRGRRQNQSHPFGQLRGVLGLGLAHFA